MRTIAVFTGARSEYGLLQPLMSEIQDDESLDLKIIVSGMHLSPEFGQTHEQITRDGFEINEKVEILLSSDSSTGIAKSMGLGMMGFSEALNRVRPDILVLLGDRFETFSMAAAAHVHNIPIAHISGGEASFGAMDDAFRHSITKMSHLHFTSAGVHQKRVVQLGENPKSVFNVGALGVENLKKLNLLSRAALNEKTGLRGDEPFFLVTYHPATREGEKTLEDFNQLLSALSSDRFSGTRVVITHPNADQNGRQMIKMTQQFSASTDGRVISFNSMGQINYLSAMKHCEIVIGNSSSGIVEAPSFKVPVVNIGNRQEGRVRAENIIDCPPERTAIIHAIQNGLSNGFRNAMADMVSPFDQPGTACRIKEIIKGADLSQIRYKRFYDHA